MNAPMHEELDEFEDWNTANGMKPYSITYKVTSLVTHQNPCYKLRSHQLKTQKRKKHWVHCLITGEYYKH